MAGPTRASPRRCNVTDVADAVLLHQLRGDFIDTSSNRQLECPVRGSRHHRWQAIAARAGPQPIAAVVELSIGGAWEA